MCAITRMENYVRTIEAIGEMNGSNIRTSKFMDLRKRNENNIIYQDN